KSASDLVNIFDKNVQDVNNTLNNLTDDILTKTFYLKNQGQVLFSSPVNNTISSTINHWVHHRGQLTVYMRLNNIPVPSIYGPSADEKRSEERRVGKACRERCT